MKLSDLDYFFPEELIAQQPSRPTRVMWVENSDLSDHPVETTIPHLIERIPAGDILVINDTKVLKRRIFTHNGLEILFLDKDFDGNWSVLFPSKKIQLNDQIKLPNGSVMTLLQKGLPQKVKVEPNITESDFERYGELPLPPYIQKARDERHNIENDKNWYQTAWAVHPGSFAAPTASLHFSDQDLQTLKNKGVEVLKITLHVGLGTFLPVKTEDLNDHQMHGEIYHVSEMVWEKIIQARKNRKGIWALGTTVTRTLETVARTQKLSGESQLLLQVGSEFKIVNRLLTNFHQPQSTLLALVAGFSGLEKVKKSYQWAIERKFKLFSYGDLSVWIASESKNND